MDWLLNQDLESTAEGKKAKYDIVDNMLSNNGDIIGGFLPARARDAYCRNGIGKVPISSAL